MEDGFSRRLLLGYRFSFQAFVQPDVMFANNRAFYDHFCKVDVREHMVIGHFTDMFHPAACEVRNRTYTYVCCVFCPAPKRFSSFQSLTLKFSNLPRTKIYTKNLQKKLFLKIKKFWKFPNFLEKNGGIFLSVYILVCLSVKSDVIFQYFEILFYCSNRFDKIFCGGRICNTFLYVFSDFLIGNFIF